MIKRKKKKLGEGRKCEGRNRKLRKPEPRICGNRKDFLDEEIMQT